MMIMIMIDSIFCKVAHKVGMKFNPDKCTFKRDFISFYGVTISADGVKPDPRKIDAIKNLPEPRTEALLQPFLGIVNYLSLFSPNIAKIFKEEHRISMASTTLS